MPGYIQALVVILPLLGIGGGGMVWHHHKYHGHDHDKQHIEQMKGNK